MSESKPILPLWPFIVADAVFLVFAAVLLRFGHHPLTGWEAFLLVLCGALGSASFLTPFLRHNADVQAYAKAKLLASQARLLAESVAQIQKIDQLAGQIHGATDQWVELQTKTAQAAESAREVAEKISTEAQAFTQFMQRAGESERNQLRVEVEKLRRAEGERLQVVVHMLDHVFALFQAARHSGQPALVEQIGQFQSACREVARRIGLVQTASQAGEAYDAKAHQLPENVPATANGLVADTVAPGYTYQGQLLRRPMVALKTNNE